jgi:quinol monooxygenase YgiN
MTEFAAAPTDTKTTTRTRAMVLRVLRSGWAASISVVSLATIAAGGSALPRPPELEAPPRPGALGARTSQRHLAELKEKTMPVQIDVANHPNQRFRIDAFEVPAAALAEFQAAMQRNMAFIKTQPGFLGHVVFTKVSGPTTFNFATIAIWENQAAIDKASEQVRAYYQRIGFDPSAMIARWGVKASLGYYQAPADLQ